MKPAELYDLNLEKCGAQRSVGTPFEKSEWEFIPTTFFGFSFRWACLNRSLVSPKPPLT